MDAIVMEQLQANAIVDGWDYYTVPMEFVTYNASEDFRCFRFAMHDKSMCWRAAEMREPVEQTVLVRMR
jgi:hypothetical protein